MISVSCKRSAHRGWQALALAGAMLTLPGCAGWDLRGAPFKDEPKIGRKATDSTVAPNRGASLYGFSTKARQIEQNLGAD